MKILFTFRETRELIIIKKEREIVFNKIINFNTFIEERIKSFFD